MVRDLLWPFRCEVMIYDPYVSGAEVESLNVPVCDLNTFADASGAQLCGATTLVEPIGAQTHIRF
jgi:hypothetical protein